MSDISPSGVRAIPHISWGSHLTHFFEAGDELRDLLVPYFKAGLGNNEACFWVTSKNFSAAQARAALREVVPELDHFERTKQIEICDAEDFYSPEDKLRPDDLVNDLIERERLARERGYSGLRTNGNCAWVAPSQWEDFQRYEALVHDAVQGRRMICMCSYHADQLKGSGLQAEVMARHDLVIPTAPRLPVAARSNTPPIDAHDFQQDLDIIAAIPAVRTILDIVCEMTGMGFSAVARVTEDRWICCASKDQIGFGLAAGGDLKVETTICNEIRDTRQGVIIDRVSAHPHFRSHHTPAMYGFESYISLPILLADGSMFGTLCAIDPKPAKVDTPTIIGMFRMFADLIALHVDSRRRLTASEAILVNERQDAELREKFIAILGHDLRNPLMALQSGVQVLQRNTFDARGTAEVLKHMSSSLTRMSDLVTSVLDFARGRLGGGFSVSRQKVDLAPMLSLVTREVQLSHPNREFVVDLSDLGDISCDPPRIGQLLSNLLSNAVVHGDGSSPIEVTARKDAGGFELAVTNGGEPIPAEALPRLFKPFERGARKPGQQGLGLGLYIASEIAKAHGGTLTATSGARTRFTFRLPA